MIQYQYSIHMAHDDVIKWKHFPRYRPFVRGIHRSPVNSPHKDQWHGALMFSLICVWINGWVNNREAGDYRRYHAHYDVIVMCRSNVSQLVSAISYFTYILDHYVYRGAKWNRMTQNPFDTISNTWITHSRNRNDQVSISHPHGCRSDVSWCQLSAILYTYRSTQYAV